MTDADSEWETDEETDVVVKLTGVIRDGFIRNMSAENNPKCSALGLMTEEPLLQIGSDLFKGTYSHPPGTHLILCESQSGDNKGDLQYLCTTDKQLDMNKLYVQEKVTEVVEDVPMETAAEPAVIESDVSEPMEPGSQHDAANAGGAEQPMAENAS